MLSGSVVRGGAVGLYFSIGFTLEPEWPMCQANLLIWGLVEVSRHEVALASVRQ